MTRQAHRSGLNASPHGDAVVLDRVEFSWGETATLQDLSLLVREGEVHLIAGENGAGKTTLLRLVMGEYPPRAGRILLWGGPATPTTRACTGLVADAEAWRPFQRLKGASLLRLWHRAYPRFDLEYARQLIDRWGLELNRRLGELSRGESRRIQIMLALAVRPRLLLMDEPLAPLDASARASVRAEVDAWMKGGDGRSALIATHDPDRWRGVATHLAVMKSRGIAWSRTLDDSVPSAGARPTTLEDEIAGVLRWPRPS